MNIPNKYCVERTQRNFNEVNRVFSIIYGKKYSNNGKSLYNTSNYMHYPPLKFGKFKGKIAANFKGYGYTELTIEQVKQIHNIT